MGCFSSKGHGRFSGYDLNVLASETCFTVNDIEALYELFKKLSSSLTGDRLIHKKELQLALFQSHDGQNLFVDRVFDLFDVKRNGVIEFGEFVKSMAIFHPKADRSEKIAFAFKLYDLRQTGYIEHGELEEMVLALLKESNLTISEDDVKSIVDKTFNDADLKGDGKIDLEEWTDYVSRNPSLIKNMTLPYLMDITITFPSFVLNSEVKESEMVA